MFGNTLSYKILADTSSFERSMSSLAGKLTAVFAGIGVTTLSKSILDAGMAFDRYKAKLSAAYGEQAQVSDGMAYIQDVSNRLALNLTSTANGFSMLAAAARGTSLQGKATVDIFEGVATAASAMKLSADDTTGVLLALTQMISKGTVQAEELRGQLGERLPGAFQLAAKAMNMTTAQLGKALQMGSVTADELLPKLAKLLKETYGDAAAEAAKSFQSNMNRVSNSFLSLKNKIFSSGVGDALSNVMKRVSSALDSAEFQKAAEKVGVWITDGINKAVDAFNLLISHSEDIKGALLGIGVVIAGMKLASLATSLISLLNPAVLVATAIVGITAALYKYRDSSVEVAGQQAHMMDVYLGIWQTMKDAWSSTSKFIVDSAKYVWDKLDRGYSAVFMTIAEIFKSLYRVAVAWYNDMTEIFSKLGDAFTKTMSGDFSGAAKALSQALLPDQMFSEMGNSAAKIKQAAIDGWNSGGKLEDLISGGFNAASESVKSVSSGILDGLKKNILEARDLRLKEEAEAKASADAMAGNTTHKPGSIISQLNPTASTGTGSGNSSSAANSIQKIIDKYVAAKAAAQGLYDAEVQGASLSIEARKKLIATITAQNAANQAVASLGSKASEAQKKQVYDVVYATELLKQKTDELAESIKKKDESHKRAQDMVQSYDLEIGYLKDMINLYKEGNQNIDQKVALLQAEKEVRSQLKDITDKADQDMLRQKALEKVKQEQNLKDIQEQTQKTNDMSREFTGNLEQGLEDSIFSGKKFDNVLKDLADSFAKMMFRNAFNNAMGGDNGNGIFSGLFSSIFGRGGSSSGSGSVGTSSGAGIGSMLSGVGSFIGGFFAEGGFTDGMKPIIVGENGPEIFKPSTSGTVISNKAMGSMVGGAANQNTFHINIHAQDPLAFKSSMSQISAQLSDAVNRGQRNR